MSVVANGLVKSINDCDAGDVVGIEGSVCDYYDGRFVPQRAEQQVAMVITAPRGRAILFKRDCDSVSCSQAEAVRAFMEQHRDDK